ncbi:MAG: undecaprenyl-diphosphate phosphatase [Synergistaceae bacterium]|nr:undecaprenyl-diphosphate phosphatase [Synergistaceae bacterium]
MNILNTNVILLGLIQGLTEFLPVSSSGHLALAQIFLGTNLPPLSYDLVLHVATTLATILFFLGEILLLLGEWINGFVNADKRMSEGWSVGWSVILGTIITAAIGIVMKNFAEAASQNSLLVAFGLIFTGVALIAGGFIHTGYGRISVLDGLFVGVAQGIAVLPGVSRSGMTMMSALLRGLGREDAFKFSFLLSIPAILGATVLQALEVGGWNKFISSLPAQWYIGAAVAFISGFLSLYILRKIVLASKWWVFGVYCLLLGVGVVVVTYLGVW